MFNALRARLNQWFRLTPIQGKTASTSPEPEADTGRVACTETVLPSTPVAYDENLLERAHTQWQFGDWQSLAQLHRDTLQHHPDRAKLALLAAAGRLQTGQYAEARQYIRLAQDWGVSRKLISSVIIAGVNNSIGRAAVASGNQSCAIKHFEESISIGDPNSDQRLLTRARINAQVEQLYLSTASEKSEHGTETEDMETATGGLREKFDFESVYTEVFSRPEYSAEDHIQYHYVLLKLHDIGFSNVFSMLDISSGRGHLIKHIQKLYPEALITSTDIKRFHQENVAKFIECDLSVDNDRQRLRDAGNYDVVVCTDVLEHLEKSFISEVIKLISDLASYSILAIANHSDVWNGQELHIIQEGNLYWEAIINKYFEVIEQKNTFNDRLMLYVLKKR